MVIESKFSVKEEAQIIPDWFRCKNRSFNHGEVNEGIKEVTRSHKVENFGFAVFHDQAKVQENF